VSSKVIVRRTGYRARDGGAIQIQSLAANLSIVRSKYQSPHGRCSLHRGSRSARRTQYWRLENLKSFDEFLERRFPESRRKAYYLMSIHEHLPPQVRKELKQMGWTKGRELAKLVRAQGQ
jgi:hypothetical protein